MTSRSTWIFGYLLIFWSSKFKKKSFLLDQSWPQRSRKVVHKGRRSCAIFQLFGAASIQVRLLFKGSLYAMSWAWKTGKSGLTHHVQFYVHFVGCCSVEHSQLKFLLSECETDQHFNICQFFSFSCISCWKNCKKMYNSFVSDHFAKKYHLLIPTVLAPPRGCLNDGRLYWSTRSRRISFILSLSLSFFFSIQLDLPNFYIWSTSPDPNHVWSCFSFEIITILSRLVHCKSRYFRTTKCSYAGGPPTYRTHDIFVQLLTFNANEIFVSH